MELGAQGFSLMGRGWGNAQLKGSVETQAGGSRNQVRLYYNDVGVG